MLRNKCQSWQIVQQGSDNCSRFVIC